MIHVGIEAIGIYVPPGRLAIAELRQYWPGVPTPGGVQTVSVAGFDEDIVTMGVEAAEVTLASIDAPVTSIDLLVVATCSSPYGEHSAAAEIGRALGLSPTVAIVDLAGSTLGGVTAVQTAQNAVLAGSATRALVVVSERRRGVPGSAVEALGAAAIALLVVQGGPSKFGPAASFRHGVPTRWRSENSPVLRNYEDARYELTGQIEPAVSAVLGGLAASTSTHLAIGPLDVRSHKSLSQSMKFESDSASFDFSHTGDLGAAGPLVDLAGLIATQPGSTIACIGVEPGSGAVGFTLALEGVVTVARHQPEPVSVSYVEYLQRFGVIEGTTPPSPIVPYAATPGAARADSEGSLAGDRCEACGSLNVPPRRLCIDCGAGRFVRERASRVGEVVTFNVQHVVAVHPEPSPVAVGVIRLKGEKGERGGQISAMFCDSNLDGLSVGQAVELVYRRLGVDDGLVKYGWKVRTVTTTSRSESSDGHGDLTGKGSS
jgi:hydroxymethylglutaryl-CoA synthase